MSSHVPLELDRYHDGEEPELEATSDRPFVSSSSALIEQRLEYDAMDDDPPSSHSASTPFFRPFSPYPTNSSAHMELLHLGHREHSHHGFSKANTTSTWRVSTISKLLIIPAVLVPLIVSALLLWAHQNHWYITGPLVTLTSAHRGVVQVVVQILSQVLGGLQIYVLCNLIAFGVRIYLVKTYMSLKYLKFFSVLVSRQFDLTLSRSLLFQLALFNLFNIAPSALWAGSITPITATSSSMQTMTIGHFQDSGYWTNPPFKAGKCRTITNAMGLFSNCPGMHTPNRLLATISTASTPTGAIRNHTKNDNTQFAYIGRSYGMGSSVGLVPIESQPLIDNYTYTEYGYNSSVTCIYNSSSTWSSKLIRSGAAINGIPPIFYVSGFLPNSDLSIPAPFYSLVAWFKEDIVAYQSECKMGRFMYAFTAGQNYSSLEHLQCEVLFTPCKYDVVVSPPGKNITVTPVQCGGAGIMDVDPSGQLKCELVGQLAWLPRVSTSLYTSLIGDAFMNNINNVDMSLRGVVLSAKETTLLAVSASLTAAIDDTFAALSSFRMMDHHTTPMPVVMRTKVLQFGLEWAIFSVVCLSVFTLLVTAEEAVRTRFWAELPLFNFVDVKTCILGAALGSGSLSRQILVWTCGWAIVQNLGLMGLK